MIRLDEGAEDALFSFSHFHNKIAKIYELRIIVIMLTKTMIQISIIRFFGYFSKLSTDESTC